MNQLRSLGIPETGLVAILTLYETLSSQVRTRDGLSKSILSTIGVKQGCPLSPTLFGLYIDKVESVSLETINLESGCLLHGNRVPSLLFADDIVLLSHSVEGLQNLIDALDAFSDRQKLVVNLSKTKLLAFNVSKATLDQTQITFRDNLIESTSTYTYLGVLFFGSRLSMRTAAPPKVC